MHRERGVLSDLSIVTGSGSVMPSQEEEFSLPGQVSENVCSLPTENEKVKWLRKRTIRKICRRTNQWYHNFKYCIQVWPAYLRNKGAQRSCTAKGQNAGHSCSSGVQKQPNAEIFKKLKWETGTTSWRCFLSIPQAGQKIHSSWALKHYPGTRWIGGEDAVTASHTVHAHISIFSPSHLEQQTRWPWQHHHYL